MLLKIRFDDEYQMLELGGKAMEELWVSLSIEGEGLAPEDREQAIQDGFEKEFNRPEYNSWHKFNRHRGYSRAQSGEDENEEDADIFEPLMEEVADDRVFRKEEIEREESESYDEICRWVRKVLSRKPKWAEAFIAVRLDGMSVNDYAASVAKDASTVSKWLSRAEKKLREDYPDR